jgi:hypothetical protein
MKIRIGFISNSSSASFIIDWQIDPKECKADDNKERIARAVLTAMDEGGIIDADLKKIMDSDVKELDDWASGYYKKFKNVINRTREINEEEGLYSTEFFTIMYNCATDFCGDAGNLLTCLEISSVAKKIDARVESDTY